MARFESTLMVGMVARSRQNGKYLVLGIGYWAFTAGKPPPPQAVATAASWAHGIACIQRAVRSTVEAATGPAERLRHPDAGDPAEDRGVHSGRSVRPCSGANSRHRIS